MFCKLMIGVAGVLGLLTLAVSAQQPAPDRPKLEKNDYRQPVIIQTAPIAGYNPYHDGHGIAAYPGGRGPEEINLTRQSEELVRAYAKAQAEDKDKIKAKLNDVLAKQFDVRQKRHESEITALESQIRKLRELVQKRQENRREIITRRFGQLVHDAEGLGW
jgi:hypothetical protein